MKKLIILFIVAFILGWLLAFCVNIYASTNDFKKLNDNIPKIQYIDKITYIQNYNDIERYGQNIEYTKEIKQGNCVDIAKLVLHEARKQGLKAEYVIEHGNPGHLLVKVYDRGNIPYYFSNGKNIGRNRR